MQFMNNNFVLFNILAIAYEYICFLEVLVEDMYLWYFCPCVHIDS